MVLTLVIWALAFESSWQQETTEKSLGQMLDLLIDETVSTYSNENENHSRVIYIKPDNATSQLKEKLGLPVSSSGYEDLDNIVQQMKSITQETNFPKPSIGENNVLREISIEVERSGMPFNDNVDDTIQALEIINSGFSKSGRPFQVEEIPDNTDESYTLGSESNLIHKYPEIIIDKITYDASERQSNEVEKPIIIQNYRPRNVKHLKLGQKKVAAETLVKLLIKKDPKKQSLGTSNEYLEHGDVNAVVRSTHIHNAYHNHVTNNLPLVYSSMPTGEKMFLGNLPESYRNLHRINNRHRSMDLNPNLQLSRWESNARHNSLMSFLRAHNLNRVHFVPETINTLSRIVYQPLYHRHFVR